MCQDVPLIYCLRRIYRVDLLRLASGKIRRKSPYKDPAKQAAQSTRSRNRQWPSAVRGGKQMFATFIKLASKQSATLFRSRVTLRYIPEYTNRKVHCCSQSVTD